MTSACAPAEPNGGIQSDAGGVDATLDASIDAPITWTTLSGQAFNAGTDTPFEGVEISVEGQIPVVTGVNGEFTIELPEDQISTVRLTHSGFLSTRYEIRMGAAPRTGLKLSLASELVWNQARVALSFPDTPDRGKVVVSFFNGGTSGGHRADWGESGLDSFTQDSNDDWVESEEVLSGGAPFLGVWNVMPGEKEFSITSPAGENCSILDGVTNHTVVAGEATNIDVFCI